MANDVLKAEFNKEDNLFLFHFFTQAASALQKHLPTTAYLADDLKKSLTFYHQNQLLSKSPLLLDPHFQKSEFFQTFFCRYSATSLNGSLLRLGMKRILKELLNTLTTLTGELLELSNLHVNQEIALYHNGEIEKHEQSSLLLVHFCETLTETMRLFEKALLELNGLIPCVLTSTTDTAIDQEFAIYLGFSGIEENPIWPLVDKKVIHHLSFLLKEHVGSSLDFLSLLGAAPSDTLLLAKSLTSQIASFATLAKDLNQDSFDLDSQRRLLVANAESISQSFAAFSLAFASRLRKHLAGKERTFSPSAAIKRQMTAHLTAKGVKAFEAHKSTSELFSYLLTNNLKPDQLIESELRKVHPAFNLDSLSLLKELYTARNVLTRSEKKETVLGKMKVLEKFLLERSSRLSLLLIAFAVAFVSLGCGLKKKPSNSLLELKPPIPFHENK